MEDRKGYRWPASALTGKEMEALAIGGGQQLGCLFRSF